MTEVLVKISLILFSTLQLVDSSGTTYAPITAKPTPEHNVHHRISFHYNKWSLEHLLIVTTATDCFCMPLTAKDVQAIQNYREMEKMEAYVISQIARNNFREWTNDDLAVRDAQWGRKCSSLKGKIYRVYRI